MSRLLAGFAHEVRAEPGNVVFDPFIVPGTGGAFFVVETYVDDSAFENHLASDHGQAFNVSLAPLIVGGRSSLTRLAAIEVAA